VASIAALEAGWITTEVGRQPWIAYRLLRVEDAVTSNGGLWWTFALTVVLYAGLGTATILVLRRMSRQWRRDDEREPAGEHVEVGA
jgi:cytochrome d ubiquinol oxidase subunit I